MTKRELSFDEVNRNVEAVIAAMGTMGEFFCAGGAAERMPEHVRAAASLVAEFFGEDDPKTFLRDALVEREAA